VEILKAANDERTDLVIMRTSGNGSIREEMLGSTAERVFLLSNGWEMLLTVAPWDLEGRPIVVGVDGKAEKREQLLCPFYGSEAGLCTSF
jgi:hypothetical protein